MKHRTHAALLGMVALTALGILAYTAIAHAETATLKAICDKDTCIVKRADLEAVLKSHNGHMNAAKKCAGLNET